VKILCVSDETDPLIYSKNISKRYGDVDLIVSAGDLPLKYYEFIISTLNKDLYFVFGNHNLESMGQFTKEGQVTGFNYDSAPQRLQILPEYGGNYIDGKVVYDKRHDLIIAGLGGSMRYNRGRNQFTESEMRHRIWRMAPKLLWNKIVHGRYVDILVTHAPPLGINDDIDRCHTGFSSFLLFIRKYKPKYLLHGHVHLLDLNQERIVQYEQTKVINVFQSFILDDPELGNRT
jgi:Icc-related predicted phosphoesterase